MATSIPPKTVMLCFGNSRCPEGIESNHTQIHKGNNKLMDIRNFAKVVGTTTSVSESGVFKTVTLSRMR